MAKVLGPMHSEQASGSVSGFTIRLWRGLHTVTTKGRPLRRVRNIMPENRALFAFLSRKWGTLTPTVRQSYDVWGQNHPQPNSFGQTIILTGSQVFMMLTDTIVRLYGYIPPPFTPPVADMTWGLATLVVAAGANAGEILCTFATLGNGPAGDKIEVRVAGGFQSRARNFVDGKFKYVGAVAGNVATYTITGLTVGLWYWVEARGVDATGQTSPWIRAQGQPHV